MSGVFFFSRSLGPIIWPMVLSVVEVFLPETRRRDLGQRSRHREQEVPFIGDTGFVDGGVVNVDTAFVRFQLPLELL